jgi:hypothetical protein
MHCGEETAWSTAGSASSSPPREHWDAQGYQPIWAFDQTEPEDAAQVAVAYGEETPSNLLLPVVPGLGVPTGLPPCPGLRGEPCRAYQPLSNRPATP